VTGDYRTPGERDPWPIWKVVLVSVFAVPLVVNAWDDILSPLFMAFAPARGRSVDLGRR
jgi:hypothetical protein